MGVRGLATYIDKNQNVLRDCELRDGPLVIDGNNLYYAIYHGLKTGHASNGDYHLFAKEIRRFFHHLRECDIVPYVVLGEWFFCSLLCFFHISDYLKNNFVC